MLLLISIAAGACTLAGALMLMLKSSWQDRELAFFLGLASGVMASVVIFDLLPSTLVAYHGRGGLTGIIFGVLLTFLASRLLKRNEGQRSVRSLGYLIMLAIALHDLPEGIAIALGGELKARTSMVIALAIGIHNMPEGMAIAAPLLMSGAKKRDVVTQIGLLELITPAGTLLGKILVSLWPYSLPLFLGLASGVMGTLVLNDLWPEARIRSASWARLGAALGMLIIILATFL